MFPLSTFCMCNCELKVVWRKATFLYLYLNIYKTSMPRHSYMICRDPGCFFSAFAQLGKKNSLRCRDLNPGPASQQTSAQGTNWGTPHPNWATLHPAELPYTPTQLSCTLLSYVARYWTTLHPLSYAAPYWATLHPDVYVYHLYLVRGWGWGHGDGKGGWGKGVIRQSVIERCTYSSTGRQLGKIWHPRRGIIDNEVFCVRFYF